MKSFRKIQFSWFNYYMHPFCNTTASSKQSVRDMHMVRRGRDSARSAWHEWVSSEHEVLLLGMITGLNRLIKGVDSGLIHGEFRIRKF